MNIEEAIKKIRELDLYGSSPAESKKAIIPIVRQIKLDQPKVVVKQEMADWLEGLKKSYRTRENMLYFITRYGWGNALEYEGCKLKEEKFGLESEEIKILLVDAVIFGYTVEKEKLYTVEIPNPNAPLEYHSRLAKNSKGDIVMEVQDWLNRDEYYQLTEKEIRKDFDWAWQFAKEVTDD
ncbi:hypothetical protein FMV2238Y02_02640 [Streptococcus canis]|uniref:Phage protein n=1 Tax=Streptococcus canis TaxID=1329 RepID=A0A3P5XMA7_STRCB|nr:DUF1642 domain-containing protein [Streptococcus canis]VDC41825.1 hypothetical protein FMV2238Y02_02640 [Streptococcus canis]